MRVRYESTVEDLAVLLGAGLEWLVWAVVFGCVYVVGIGGSHARWMRLIEGDRR